MQANLTQLRSHLYQWIDRLIETGEPIDIERHGAKIQIALLQKPASKPKKIVRHTKVYDGNAEELVHMDWSKEWSEKI